jgi:hypothetical protein
MTAHLDSPSRLTRFRSRHAWLDHLVRAGERYTETHGSHYAAAVMARTRRPPTCAAWGPISPH